MTVKLSAAEQKAKKRSDERDDLMFTLFRVTNKKSISWCLLKKIICL